MLSKRSESLYLVGECILATKKTMARTRKAKDWAVGVGGDGTSCCLLSAACPACFSQALMFVDSL